MTPHEFIKKWKPVVGAAAILGERTLTNLYNERPQWLVDAHDTLDRAVAAAYGWPEDISTEDALEKLLALNLARAGQVSSLRGAEQATKQSTGRNEGH